MSIKILTKNAIENTNIDGARANNFNAGRRSGIVKGVLNEGTLSALSSNVIALDTCELRICGHRIVLDQVETRNLTSTPATTIRYSLIAQIVVDENSNPQFDLFIQLADTPLIQQNLDKVITGAGTYQLEIGRFSYNTSGQIVDVVRTAELITGSGQNGYDYINIGEVKTTMVQSGINAEVDIENVIDEETGEKKTNFNFSIPETAGTSININGEQQANIEFDADPQEQIDNKADKVAGATANNIAAIDSNGNLKDSGIPATNIANKVINATQNNLAGLDANGDLIDSGVDPTTLAKISNLNSLSMAPTDEEIEFSAPSNGGGYWAAHNGWVAVSCSASAGGYMEVGTYTSNKMGVRIYSPTGGGINLFLPVQKGELVAFYYANVSSIKCYIVVSKTL